MLLLYYSDVTIIERLTKLCILLTGIFIQHECQSIYSRREQNRPNTYETFS